MYVCVFVKKKIIKQSILAVSFILLVELNYSAQVKGTVESWQSEVTEDDVLASSFDR